MAMDARPESVPHDALDGDPRRLPGGRRGRADESVFSNITANRTMQEMLALANEMAQRIAYDTRDWTEAAHHRDV